MADPRDKAGASAPPTLGEGCLARFDPNALSEEHGADFSAAAQLWRALNPLDACASAPATGAPAGTRTPGRPPAGRSSK